MKPLHSLLVVSLALVFTANGQSDIKKPNSVEIQTNLLVLDEKGAYATGVKQSDIKIFEGDVEKELTSFVQLEASVDIAIVADNTGSVRKQLDDITRIGKILVASLRKNDNAQVIRFVDRDKVEVIQPWTSNKADLVQALDDMFVEGGPSAVLDALYLASQDMIARHARDPKRRYAVVLISDGNDLDSYYTEKDLFKLLENSPVQIFTITLTKDLATRFWSQDQKQKTVEWVVKFVNTLAAQTGGTSFILREKSTNEDLLNALKALLGELRSQFVIKYTSNDVTKKTNVRKLSATIAETAQGEKRQAYIKDTVVIVPPKR